MWLYTKDVLVPNSSLPSFYNSSCMRTNGGVKTTQLSTRLH